MTVRSSKTNWIGIALFAFASGCGIVAFLFGGKYIHENKDAIGVITTVFSIFAGFIVAITTILGTPVGDTEKQTWQSLELRRNNVFRRLTKQKWLFISYLSTLLLIFGQTLIAKTFPDISILMERLFLGMAVFAFILSIGLPGALISMQISRYDELIDEKKSNPPT